MILFRIAKSFFSNFNALSCSLSSKDCLFSPATSDNLPTLGIPRGRIPKKEFTINSTQIKFLSGYCIFLSVKMQQRNSLENPLIRPSEQGK
ncbi:Uncharacterised protein [Chlamydia trachomatis]|nr:Uncharacterised protein [Chlamydia trachomatis]